MPIGQQTLDILEFPKILLQLARFTSFSASRELVQALTPSTDAYEIRRRLRRTREARRLFDEQADVGIGGARDVRGPVGLARRGGVLDAAVFLDIAATLSSTRRLRGLLLKLDAAAFALLRELADGLPSLPAIEERIARTVGDDGSVLDSASPQLGRLRSEIRIAYNRLHEKLQSMISSSMSEALQEPIITVRNGRYVVPVKAASRRVIRGLVHDQSASGATLYIEPLATVELNNRWRELQLAEEQEVARILAELSTEVGEHGAAIDAGVVALAELDVAFALARYAGSLDAVEPEIVERDANGAWAYSAIGQHAPLLLTKARHPLLDKRSVVPTDMWLGGEFQLLLITGPNTGGKTVALKTTGLLALMAQAGMHIPAAEPSRLPVFGQVFADIGDEQSIEQSLSTFSSHMTNIIRILRAIDVAAGITEVPPAPPVPEPVEAITETAEVVEEAAVEPRPRPRMTLREEEELERLSNWRKVEPGEWAPIEALTDDPLPSLVLLDELGAGTDPVEGAALARAIIERLLARDVMGVATTHYAELKAFAYATDGVVNGSVEFDIETLRPTYRLTIGLPGRSNALAIAERLGLSADLAARARSTMAREDAQIEDLLSGIYAERTAATEELRQAEAAHATAAQERDRLLAERREFDERRETEWQAARAALDAEFAEVRGQLRRLRDDFRTVSVSRQWLEEADRRLQEAKEQSAKAPAPVPAAPAPPPGPPAPRPIQAGDTVLVRSVGLTGEVLSIDEEEQTAEVQVGGFRMRADLGELRREKKGEKRDEPRQATPARPSVPAAPDVAMSFDMRGWRAADVPDRLDRYINDAYLAGLPFVRIIHGKGTGALRQVVRDMLTGHPLVTSIGGGGADGGEGVTVARLSER